MVNGIIDSCTAHYGCTKHGADRGRVGQGWLPGGGDAEVMRRNQPGEGYYAWQGALTDPRSGG